MSDFAIFLELMEITYKESVWMYGFYSACSNIFQLVIASYIAKAITAPWERSIKEKEQFEKFLID